MLTFGSLFSGIGGIDLGLERAGMVCKWQVEIDDYATKVLEKHWPNVRRYRDVRECRDLEPVQLICGGFPCQPHSVAGKRRGKEDDRDLWPEYRRIVAELHPTWVLGENVPGIRTTMLDEVLSDLEDLDYAIATFVIPACAFDAPHRRERVFIVAYANQIRRSSKGLLWSFSGEKKKEGEKHKFGNEGSDVAHADRARKLQQEGRIEEQRGRAGDGGEDVADAKGTIRSKPQAGDGREMFTGGSQKSGYQNQWAVEPDVGRVAHGIPSRVDRLKCLGNAVVPQVAQFIGEIILAHIDG